MEIATEMRRKICKNRNCGKFTQRNKNECQTCLQRKWVERHPVTAKFIFWKRNTKKRGIPNTVSLYQYTVFGIETGYFYYLSIGVDMTIDRKDSTKGYEVGNLQLLTRADNSRKARREISYTFAQRGAKQPGDVF